MSGVMMGDDLTMRPVENTGEGGASVKEGEDTKA